VLRGKQPTLGACVILLKRATPSLAGISKEEMSELPEVINWFEKKASRLWGAEKFNYMALMMKDPYVHFHAFPRYSAPITFNDQEICDSSWPRSVDLRSQALAPSNLPHLLVLLRED
jgi:diadenosine tetraphosphate (Ap4A) HIT family hydrolase